MLTLDGEAQGLGLGMVVSALSGLEASTRPCFRHHLPLGRAHIPRVQPTLRARHGRCGYAF